MHIPKNLKKIRKVNITPQQLFNFEEEIKKIYEKGKIKAPIHLSRGNEKSLIEIFSYISLDDWVFSSWRNHYHALLHGISPNKLRNLIVRGKSMGVISKKPKFYSSSIVGGSIPIALGTAMALKRKNKTNRVFCFIGDMTYETGIFHEAYKYVSNFNLPLTFIVEDNNLSTNTPTDKAWKTKSSIKRNIFYYKYKRVLPHHGTGNWVLF